MEDDPDWVKKIDELMEAVDSYIPVPERAVDKPFLMPIEDIFSISGRGTVVTGRIERGIVKVGEEMEIVGFKPTFKTVITGVEMFKKLLDEGRGGRQRGIAVAGDEKGRSGTRAGGGQDGIDHAAHEIQGGDLRIDERRRRTAHAVLQGIPAAVLFQNDGCNRIGGIAGRRGDGDAGRQRELSDRADHAGSTGEGIAIRDS